MLLSYCGTATSGIFKGIAAEGFLFISLSMESAIRQVAALQNESQKENIQVDVFKLMKQIISMSLFYRKVQLQSVSTPE